MRKLLFLWIVVLMISSVYALGVTPGRTTLDFKPGLQKKVHFEIINSGGTDMKLALSVEGELADYIHLETRNITLSSSEHSKMMSYDITLPDNLKPGLRTGRVIITELPKKLSGGESYVSATLSVAVQLYVNVPYPGKYASSEMIVYNAAQGKDATFVFPVVSKGEFDLTSVRANVDIYNSLGSRVDSFNTPTISVPSGKKKEIVYKWKADVPIGNYRAVASVIYDGGVINLEKTFAVGNKELELQEIRVNSFTLGQIVKLEMLVENKWSEPIKKAYISTKIKNAEGNVVSKFESPSYDISPLAKQVFVSYWDTSGVMVGDYQAEVSVNYGEKTSKKNLEFKVSKDSLNIVGLGYVISPGEGGGTEDVVVVLGVAVAILVLINLLWFLLFRKKMKK